MDLENKDSNKLGSVNSGTPSADNGVIWKDDASKIQIHFSYTDGDPYWIYCSGSKLVITPTAPTVGFSGNTVVITNTTDGAQIFYTLDGTDPTNSSSRIEYSEPFAIEKDVTVKAVAYKNQLYSEEKSVVCTYRAPYSFYVLNDGNWGSVNMWLWSITPNKNVNVFGENGWPGADVLAYDESKVVNYTCSVDRGYVGDTTNIYKVTVSGSVNAAVFSVSGNNQTENITSDFSGKLFKTSSKSFVTLSGEWRSGDPALKGKVSTPVISVYDNDTNHVKISTDSSDATIYYTTDGTDPTTSSTQYTGTFYITGNTTIKAIAVKAYYTDSDIASSTITYAASDKKVVYMMNDDAGWGMVQFWSWTEDNNYVLASSEKADNTNILNFSAPANEGHSCVVTKGSIGGEVVYRIELCDDAYGIKFGGNDAIYPASAWNGKLFRTKNGNNMESLATGTVWQPAEQSTSGVEVELDGYYLVGDLNKWLNDGGYEGKDLNNNPTGTYSYGYDPLKYGIATDYKFEPVKDANSLPKACTVASSSQWYSIDITQLKKTDMPGKLFGQFLIYEGGFLKKEQEKIVNNRVYSDTYYKVNWDKKTYQYNWGKAEQEAYTENIEGIDKGLKPDNLMSVPNDNTDNRNVCLAHNYYNNAVLFFNPTTKQIYLQVDDPKEDAKDLYIYYARSSFAGKGANVEEEKPVITINSSSVNTNNYYTNVEGVNGGKMELVKADGTEENPPLRYNNAEYYNFYRLKLNPGMEAPAGQKMTATIKADNYTTDYFVIDAGNLYLTDYIHVFYNTESMAVDTYNNGTKTAYEVAEIGSVECRVYGYSEDGSKIQVCGKDGVFVDADPTDDQCWATLNRGTIDSSKFKLSNFTVKGWTDYDAASDTDGKKGKVWSTFSTDPNKVMTISPANANKFIQFRVKYKLSTTKKSVKSSVAATDADGYETLIMPDYFETSRPAADASDTSETSDYTWALTGTNFKLDMKDIETAIERILADEAEDDVEGAEVETIYYNLQGQRVNNPDRGIYIRVRGNHADKVAL
jgi:hypothetical protein